MSIKEHPPQSSDRLHVPVLLDAVREQLQPKVNQTYLDLTAGYGGHAKAILAATQNYPGATLVDRDSFAIEQLQGFVEQGTRLLHTDFASAASQLIEEGKQFDMILIDLGVSSPQLDISERGFSFTHDGPLDMRMDRRQTETADSLVNRLPEGEIVRIVTKYGDVPLGFARRIANTIVKNRPIKTTKELADLILEQHHGKWQKVHPATRTFQALRIAVNNELRQVETVLPLLPQLLTAGGRIAIISFHSLEDRLVKQYFSEQRQAGYEAELRILTKKPISGSDYDVHNPRARSAKLRAAVKI